MTLSLAVVPGSERVALPGARALGRTNPHTVVEVMLKLRRIKPLVELENKPRIPMSREQMAAEHGASREDIRKVESVFAELGLTVLRSDAATRSVRLAGPVSRLEKAFGVTLFNYAHASGPYRGRVGSVHVPEEVKDIVEGVFGLDNRRAVQPRRQPVRYAAMPHNAAPPDIPASWYKPSELARRYEFPAGDGEGQTVGILEFGGGYFESDLANFCRLCDIAPLPSVQTVSVDGTSTASRDGAEGEVMLDVEVVAGVCPKASLVVYFAEFSIRGWIAAIDAAVHDQANDPGVVSVSWGYAETQDIWTKQGMKQVNQALLEAAHLGITVCVASGDDGSSGAIDNGHAYVNFPTSSPYALSVGGTTIPAKGSAQPDIVWKEGDGLREDQGGSTGGGESTVFHRPSWQSAIDIPSVNPHAIAGRIVPDISANADWDASPYLLAVDGGIEPNGGTSAATPLVGALLTLINAERVAASKSRVGFVTPQLYLAPSGEAVGSPPIGSLACTDVVDGDNITARVGGYAATPGFDAASGWGTPIGTRLAQLLA